MNFIPAIDLKDKKCVRLEKGIEKNLTIFNNNPLEQAKYFEDNGCSRIHIVDLDGAFGRPNINRDIVLEIRKKTNLIIEFGGGIKSKDDISFWIKEGINFLIVGSLAVKNQKLIINMSKNYPNKIYIALDILNQKIMIKGWVEESGLSTDNIFDIYNESLIRGYIFTDISRDGMLRGLNMRLIKNLIYKTQKNIIVGGGLSDYSDLSNLKKIKTPNLEGVIAGKSFYSGSIKIDKALKIFNLDA